MNHHPDFPPLQAPRHQRDRAWPAVSDNGLLAADAGWPDAVRAVMSSRSAGLSRAPFDSWNLGDHVGDEAAAVAANRDLLRQRMGVHPVFLRQVHGMRVVELTTGSPDGLDADACWTRERHLACTVMVADCLPLLLSAADGSSVAAVHAGWRGLLGIGGHGVIESLLESWPAAQTATQRADLLVWLGPCIGPLAFEVGAEVRGAFVADDPEATKAFRPFAGGSSDKYLADLPLLARQRLARSGIGRIAGNDGSRSWCTVSQPSVFFSHRRDAGRLGSTGRMAASIWRV